MKLRLFLTAACAVSALAVGTGSTPAQADEGVDVGGGAAGIVADVTVAGDQLKPAGYRAVRYTISTPRVEMGANGGSYGGDITSAPSDLSGGLVTVNTAALTKAVADLPVKAKIAHVSVSGNRFGTPYATAAVVAQNVSIPGQRLELGALSVQCRWDTTGATASVTQTKPTGDVIPLAPNTTTELPGLGTLTLNDQYIQTIDRGTHADGSPRYMQVIHVSAARLRLTAAAADLYNTTEVIVGLASCDPLNVPNLGGIKLSPAGASSG